MSAITKEWLQKAIADIEATRDEIPFGLDEDDRNTLAAMKLALTSLEAAPVAWIVHARTGDQLTADGGYVANAEGILGLHSTPLYTAPPAPASVPDERAAFNAWNNDTDCPLAGRDAKTAAWLAWSRRAAMLQGAEQQQNAQQNIPENIPATQFKPVADLYGLTSPTGGETSFTFDAVEARDFIDGGWSCQEYVELERFQDAVIGNSPVIPDGWVLVPVDATRAMIDAAARVEEDGYDAMHKAMIAAAPQQEVK